MLLNVYGNQDDSLAGMVIDIRLHQMCNLKKPQRKDSIIGNICYKTLQSLNKARF